MRTKEAESLIEQSLAHPAHEETEERADRWRAIREPSTRGMLLHNGGAVVGLEGETWRVRTPGGGSYRVDLAEESCTCPDYEYRGRGHGVRPRTITEGRLG